MASPKAQDPRRKGAADAAAPPPEDAPWRKNKRRSEAGDAPWRSAKKKAATAARRAASEQWQAEVQACLDRHLAELEFTSEQVVHIAVETETQPGAGGSAPKHASAWLARSPTLRVAVRSYLKEACRATPGTPTDDFGLRVVVDALVAQLEVYENPISDLLAKFQGPLERSGQQVRVDLKNEARHYFHGVIRQASAKFANPGNGALDEQSCKAIAERVTARMFQDEALGPTPVRSIKERAQACWQEQQSWVLSLLPGVAAFERRETEIMRNLSVAAVEDQLREAPRWSARFVCAALPFSASAGFEVSLKVFQACAGSGAEGDAIHSFVQTFLPSHPTEVEKFVEGLGEAGSSTIPQGTYKTLVQCALRRDDVPLAWRWLKVMSLRDASKKVDFEALNLIAELEQKGRGQLKYGHFDIMLRLLTMADAPPPDLVESVAQGVEGKKAGLPWNAEGRDKVSFAEPTQTGQPPPWSRPGEADSQALSAPSWTKKAISTVQVSFLGDRTATECPVALNWSFTGSRDPQ